MTGPGSGTGTGTTSVTLTGVTAGATIVVFTVSNSGATTGFTASGFLPRGPLSQSSTTGGTSANLSYQALIQTASAGGTITCTPTATGGGTVTHCDAYWTTGFADVDTSQNAIVTVGRITSGDGMDGSGILIGGSANSLGMGPIGTIANGCRFVSWHMDISGTPTWSVGTSPVTYTAQLNTGGVNGRFIQTYDQASAALLGSNAGNTNSDLIIGIVLALQPTAASLPTVGVRQIAQFDDLAGQISGNYNRLALPFTTLAGSTLLIIGEVAHFSGTICQAAQNTGLGSPAPTGDVVNGQYTQILNFNNTESFAQNYALYAKYNASAVPVGDLFTLNFTADDDFRSIWVIEVAGVTATPYLGSNSAIQNAVAAGTNNVKATVALGTTPCVIIAYGADSSGNYAPPLASVTPGTGATIQGTGDQFDSTAKTGFVTQQILSNPGTAGSLYNAAWTGSSDDYNSFFIALATSSSGLTLLAYLQSLSSGSPPYFLSGQHTFYYGGGTGTQTFNSFSSGTTAATAAMQGASTTYAPAVLGLSLQGPYNGGSPTQESISGTYGIVALANAWTATGGIVHLSTWLGNPASSGTASGAGANNDQSGGNPWPDVITQNGNSVITAYQSNLAAIAALLNQINGQVMLRPFVEINLSGNWWYAPGAFSGAVTGADFQTLWIQTRSDLLSLITNPNLTILWGYNVNVQQGSSTYLAGYPGSAYVDFVGFDAYSDTPGTAATSDACYTDLVSTGKPIFCSEVGNGTFSASDTTSYETMLTNLRTNCPDVIGWCIWCQGWSQGGSANTNAQRDAFYTDSNVIQRSGLPAGI